MQHSGTPNALLAGAKTIKEASVELNNGVELPAPALGTWLLSGETCRKAVKAALEAGYRHLATAHMYDNEQAIGQATRLAQIPRNEVFVTSKFTGHGYRHTINACNKSLSRLNTDYLDLFLLHWPGDGDKVARSESWKAMENLLQQGKCRAIGVSNFTVTHLDQLLSTATIIPAVNQFEFHPKLVQQELVDFCRSKGIAVMSYMPLGAGNLIDNAKITGVASRYNKTAAQVILRWHLQHGVVPIPKSSHPERIAENSKIFDFELSEKDMQFLDEMNCNRHYDWDPTNVQ